MDKVKSYLERSAVPIGDKYLSIKITSDFIAFVVLIYGQMVNSTNEEEVFTAPCLIPPTVTRIIQVRDLSISYICAFLSSRLLLSQATCFYSCAFDVLLTITFENIIKETWVQSTSQSPYNFETRR